MDGVMLGELEGKWSGSNSPAFEQTDDLKFVWQRLRDGPDSEPAAKTGNYVVPVLKYIKAVIVFGEKKKQLSREKLRKSFGLRRYEETVLTGEK